MGGATSDNTLVQGYTGPNSTIGVPSVADQVRQYNASAAADSLHAIMIGINDIFFNANVTAQRRRARRTLGSS